MTYGLFRSTIIILSSFYCHTKIISAITDFSIASDVIMAKRVAVQTSMESVASFASLTSLQYSSNAAGGSAHNELKNLCMFKVLLVGDSGVGKTSVLLRYVDAVYHDAFLATVGLDFKIKTVRAADGRPIKLQIWDTAGQERYRTMTLSYYRGAMGFLIVFDVTNEISFTNVRYWASQIQQHSNAKSLVILGNKCDVADGQRRVTREQALRMADEIGAEYFECSARDDKNVNEVFFRLIDQMLEQVELHCDLAASSGGNSSHGQGGNFVYAGAKGSADGGGGKPYIKPINSLLEADGKSLAHGWGKEQAKTCGC